MATRGRKPKEDRANPEYNRVWIELERPGDKAHGDEICEKINAVLRMMSAGAIGTKNTRHFWWNEHRNCYAWGDLISYTDQIDNGVWLDLDALSEIAKQAE